MTTLKWAILSEDADRTLENQLTFSAEKVRRFYDSLSEDERKSLDVALDYIKSVPFEHGDIITKRLMPTVMVYTYDDGS